MSASSAVYAAFQGNNPEQEFNEDLVFWRERDDAAGYLEDVFAALEVVPGITFNGVTVERDESRFPTDLTYNDIEPSRMDLAQVHFTLEMQDNKKDIVLSIFLPKLVDRLFYHLNGSIYYPILQLVDRGTYVTKKTFTLKTLLMPLVFRRDTNATITDSLTGTEHGELVYTLDLFRNKINVFRYFFASRGISDTLAFLGVPQAVEGDEADIQREGAEVVAGRCRVLLDEAGADQADQVAVRLGGRHVGAGRDFLEHHRALAIDHCPQDAHADFQ
jgi:hypothetical protein